MDMSNNAILVHADASGNVLHRFCPEVEARAFLKEAQERLTGASMFAVDSPDAELIYQISPDLRDRVDHAKVKLKADLRFSAALDKHNVPRDPELRRAVHSAFGELGSI